MELMDTLNQFFKAYKKQISIDELITKLKIKNDEINLVLEALFSLEKAGKIYYDKNNTYMHVSKDFYLHHGILHKSKSGQFFIKTKDGNRITIKGRDLAEGKCVFVQIIESAKKHPKYFEGKIIRTVKKENPKQKTSFIVQEKLRNEGNYFYIRYQDKRIFIPKESLHTAFAEDTVNVQINGNVGRVIDVIKRHNNKHIFECKIIQGKQKWIPIGPSYGMYTLKDKTFNPGDLIQAEIEGDTINFVKKIDKSNTIQDKINALVLDYGFSSDFSLKSLEEVKKISNQIPEEEIKKRVDLRNLETFTIDPVDAKDLDDAVSLECIDGIYHLYVHLANPAYYVKLNSEMFKEAFRRCFSVYPASSVIPLLSEELSNGVCSLNENGDKLAFTLEFFIDKNGKIMDFKVYKSIIKSDKQMNYDTVNKCFDGDIDESYKPFLPTLYKIKELSDILQNIKTSRGAISLENDEVNVEVDESGNPISILNNQRGIAENMIENIMLLSNEQITKFAYYLELPWFYRNHEQPTVQKQANLKNNLSQKGYFVQKIGNIDRPELLQRILVNLTKGKNKEERKYISSFFAKSMSRAYYSNNSIGHYGLALDHYGTFTSPARRITDFVNQMVIDEFLENGIETKKMDIFKEITENSSEYISEKQKDADNLEVAIDEILLNTYAEKFIDKELNAKIIFISNKTIHIKTENGLVGVIPSNKKIKVQKGFAFMNDTSYKVNDPIKVVLQKIEDKDFIFDTPRELHKQFIKK